MLSLYLLPAALFHLAVVSADSQCYWRADNAIIPEAHPGWFACHNTQQTLGGAQLCCMAGAQCGEDSICRTTSSSGGYNYYVGGCTDGNYNDPVCRKSCTGDNETWIQWDSSENAWACCGDNGCDGTTTGETFKGVAPAQYSAVPSVATSASSSAATSTKSSTTSSTGAAGTTPASSDDNSDGGNGNDDGGLSSSTIGGIAAGVAVGVIAVLAAVGFFVWRRRRSNKMNDTAEPAYRDDKWHSSEQSTPPEYASHYTPTHAHQPYPPQSAYGQQEIYAKRAQGAELDSALPLQSPQEMPAQGSKVFGSNVHELQSSSPPQRHELGGEGSGTK